MQRFKVFVSRSDFVKEAMDLLTQRGCELVSCWSQPNGMPRNELLQCVRGVHGIFCTSTEMIDKELMDAAGPNLKVVATSTVGYNHISVDEAKARGIKIGYTPNTVTDATAELTVALLLATSRRLLEGNRELLNGRWVWTPTWLCGRGLKGATVGIFGMGRIGQAVMERLIPFGVAKFVYAGRTEKAGIPAEFVTFDKLLAISDFVIVTAALTEETKEIFNEATFAKMKPTAIFVNTSRGGLVQQDALIEALKSGKIWAAGLDVMTPEPLPTDHELTKLKNCVLIPHLGTALIETEAEMAMLTARNIIAGLYDEEMPAQLC